MTAPEPLRVDAWVLAIGATIIAILNIVDLFDPEIAGIPLSPTAFGITVGYITVTIGFFFTRMKSVLPFARQAIFDRIVSPILVLNNSGQIVDMNRAWLNLTGNKLVMYPGQLLENMLSTNAMKFKDIIESASSNPQEVLWEQDNGKSICFETLAYPVIDSMGKILGKIIVLRDITQHKLDEDIKKRVELQAHLANRLNTFGEMALGVAHEINTPLTTVVHRSRLLAEKNVSVEIKKDVEIIHDEAKRAIIIARNLMSFSRKHSLVRQATRINEIIADVLRLRHYIHKSKRIKVNIALDTHLPPIVVDYYQIQEVFLNIVLNAEDALVQIRQRRRLSITTERDDNMIRIIFTDNGPGITPENLDRIFDPFFTTKSLGSGIGLGLSIAYGIVEMHGGKIFAKSELDKGATFVVELPFDDVVRKNNYK